MFFWFAGLSWFAVWAVFRSPAVDYRLVMVGSVLPVVELAFGRPAVLHTLVGAVAAMAAVMLVARGRRLRQRRWLGLPIGLFAHLTLDGTWTDKHLFWWPAFGWRFADRDLPEASLGVLALAMELVGLGAVIWMAKRFRLNEAQRRRQFLRSGQVGRDLDVWGPGAT